MLQVSITSSILLMDLLPIVVAAPWALSDKQH
jgi:hypothetical protein